MPAVRIITPNGVMTGRLPPSPAYGGDARTAAETAEARDVLWNAPYPVNAQGENDGALVIPGNSHLDLILARGIDGTSGFVRAEELELNSWGETSKDTALFMKRYEGVQLIPLYDLNGRLLARI